VVTSLPIEQIQEVFDLRALLESELLHLCETGEVKKAAQYLRKHIHDAGSDLVKLLKKRPTRPARA